MLIIYYPINLVYVPTVRSGSTSIRRYLEKTLHSQYYNYHIARSKTDINPEMHNFYIHTSINEVLKYIPGTFNFFTSIRNPFEKLVSVWECRNNEDYHSKHIRNMVKSPDKIEKTFEDFLRKLYDLNGHLHVDKEIYYLNGSPACQHYVQTENLYTDLDNLLKQYNIYVPNISKKKLNKSVRKKVSTYYKDSKLIDLVYQSYSWEIEKFNYKLN
jgi:hypothetical protein